MGDSIIAGGNYLVTGPGSILSASGTTVTVTVANHTRFVGSQVFIGGALDDRFNGTYTVATRVSSSIFTYQSPNDFGAGPVSDLASTVQVMAEERYVDRNALLIANSLAGSPIGRLVNRAVSGSTTTKQLSRITQDVLSLSPDVVLWGPSTNDARADLTAAQMIANLKSGVDQLVAAGLLVILHTGTPFDSGATSYTTARLDAYTAAQAWCREYARAKRDVILFDMFALLTDSATATGDFKSSYPVADKVHISPYGHQRLASSATPPSQSLVGILNTLYPSAKRYGVYNRRDDRNAASAATNYAYNPLLQGTSGTVLGTASGNVPTSWTGTNGSGPAVAFSVASRSDGLGNDAVATLGGSGTGTIDLLGTNVQSLVTAGDVFQLSANVQGSSLAGIGYIRLYIDANIDSVAVTIDALGPSSLTPYWPDNFDGIFRGVKFTVPSGSITVFRPRLQISVSATSSAIIKLGLVEMRKMNYA